ncbi:MAG: hypothetical protein QOF24_1460 [Verrucomicrobiota bacterium]
MTRHHQDGARRMSHHVFRGDADQDMFEAGRAVGGSHDQIRAVLEGSRADLLAGYARPFIEQSEKSIGTSTLLILMRAALEIAGRVRHEIRRFREVLGTVAVFMS